MKHVIHGFVVAAAIAGFCLPRDASAAVNATENVVDIQLAQGGVLLGQVVSPQGLPQAGVPVALESGGKQIGRGQTDAGGYFAFRGVPGGVYQLNAAAGRGLYRAWTTGTAPPDAQPGAMLVAGEDLVRGHFGRLRFWLSKPWVWGGLAATAVAVPVAIALSDDDDDEQPVSP